MVFFSHSRNIKSSSKDLSAEVVINTTNPATEKNTRINTIVISAFSSIVIANTQSLFTSVLSL